MRMLFLYYAIAVACFFIPVSTACAATYVVKPDSTGDFETIAAALSAAHDGDVIELADGTFVGSGNRDISYRGKAITIRSQSGNAEACIIDCGGEDRGFRFVTSEQAGSVLEAVTVTNGFVVGEYGGAVECRGASPTLVNVIIANNHASYSGGGVACVNGSSPILQGCMLSENEADLGGGGVYCAEAYTGMAASHPSFQECSFEGNHAGFGYGGAVDCPDGATFANCVFEQNAATWGGGVACAGTTAFTSCRFIENETPRYDGGGVLAGGLTSFADCVFISNEAGSIGSGGGVCVLWGGSASFTTCSFWGNSADEGGGLACGEAGCSVNLERTIIAFSLHGGAISSEEGNPMSLDCCDIFANTGGDWTGSIAVLAGQNGNFSVDPLFCDAAGGDLTLAQGSPCLSGNHPAGEPCGLIGALGLGCAQQPVSRISWGNLKTVYPGH